jgi:hypothetical protein
LDTWSAAEKAWGQVGAAWRLGMPKGAWNSRAKAEAALQAALSHLLGPPWSKVRRLLQRPQLLTFLDQAREGLCSLPVAGELLAAAVRLEGRRRQPEGLQGEKAAGRAVDGREARRVWA